MLPRGVTPGLGPDRLAVNQEVDPAGLAVHRIRVPGLRPTAGLGSKEEVDLTKAT
jgi:hypothetical protein